MLCSSRFVAPGAQRAPAPPVRGRGQHASAPAQRRANAGKLHAVAPAAAAPRVSEAATAAFVQWLQQGGVDTGNVKPAFFEEGLGWAAAKDVKAKDKVLAVPKKLWISQEAVEKSKIGPLVADQPPWVQIALFVIAEKADPKSKWAPYFAILPSVVDLPMFWSEAELSMLEGSQLGTNVEGYRTYVKSTWEGLKAGLLQADPAAFPPAAFTEEAFTWAFATLRSRVVTEFEGAGGLALIPGLDLFNHSGRSDAAWQFAAASLFDSEPKGFVAADCALKPGEQIYINYGPAKLDSQFALDMGFVDPSRPQPGFLLQLGIPESDRFADDKLDVLEVAGLPTSPEFRLKASEPPPEELRIFLRLLNLGGTDAFLLEPLFRETCWQLISEPVSLENEVACCGTVVGGCGNALAGYSTTASEDEQLLKRGGLDKRSEMAVRVRLGEKQALSASMEAYREIMEKAPKLEYYQERRLRSLKLLDDSGDTTYDGLTGGGFTSW